MRRLDLSGKVVVVTGGANGIGLAVARSSARRGASVALLDTDVARAQSEAAGLGPGAIALQADVCDLDELEAATATVVERLGRIDVVVANAGIGPDATTIDGGDRAHQRRVLDVNLHGVWHTCWATGAQVADSGGHLVIVSSIAAFVPTPAWAAYAAAKAGVEALGRSMRIELAPTGATVGVVHFGMVATDLVARFERDDIPRRLEAMWGGVLTRRVTPDAAGEALVKGIERRAPRTVFPARWIPAYALRGIVGPLADAVLVRDPRTRRVMRDVRARDATAGVTVDQA